MNIKYFTGVKTLEELKARYKKLAMENHPDRGGNVEIMKAINAEYDFMAKTVKSVGKDGTEKKTEKWETPEAFRDLINSLMKFVDITIEVIGSWVWVGGNTFAIKENLKSLGFRWSKSKKLWYKGELLSKDSKNHRYRGERIENIRAKYGSSGILQSKGVKAIQG